MAPSVVNVHHRVLRVPMAEGEALLRSLATHDDRLWPGDKWWRQRFDGGLVPGARGGHGPVRYKVESVAPRSVVYRFPRRGWFRGTHRFDLHPHPDGCELVHTLEGTLHGRGLVLWPAFVHPLHDALVEDVLDRAQAAAGDPPGPSAYSLRVRVLRRLALSRWKAGLDAPAPSPQTSIRP